MLRNLKALCIAIPLCLSSLQAHAEASLDSVSDWLNGWNTMTSPITQKNSDGSTSHGTLSMQRPGRMRVDYSDQDALFLVTGGSISVFDGVSKGRAPEVYPLNKTPLWLILRPEVDLKKSGAIKSTSRSKGIFNVTVQDPKRADLGYIVLHFADRDKPFLTGWTTHNDIGEVVRVSLTKPIIGQTLKGSTFKAPALRK